MKKYNSSNQKIRSVQKSSSKKNRNTSSPQMNLIRYQQACGNKVVARMFTDGKQGEKRDGTARNFEQMINSSKGRGNRLDRTTCNKFSHAFNADFSGVRIHSGPDADQMARSIQARAFTTGKDIFFREGEFNTESRVGRELLAHELTHVIQQEKNNLHKKEAKDEHITLNSVSCKKTTSLVIQGKLNIGSPNDLSERQADLAAATYLAWEDKSTDQDENVINRVALDRFRGQDSDTKLIQNKEAKRSAQALEKADEEETAPVTTQYLSRKSDSSTIVLDTNGSMTSSQLIQLTPVGATLLVQELTQYGLGVLQGLVGAQRDAIDDFHDTLRQKASTQTGVWALISGAGSTIGIGAAGAGSAATAIGSGPAAVIGIAAGLITAAGAYLVGNWTSDGVEQFLNDSRRRCRQIAEAHGRGYRSSVLSLANSFGTRVAAGQERGLSADTEQYGSIHEVFRRRILEAPSNQRVYDLKWNELSDRWNQYLRTSTYRGAQRGPDIIYPLMVSRRRVRP